MSSNASKADECFIVVKAQPHRSSKYFETVCCAGVGRDGKWRRQYPVPFRILNDEQQFKRWNWIRYTFVKSKEDRRVESQKVVPESLELAGTIPRKERAGFLAPLVRGSLVEADERGESLTLLRPVSLELKWAEKTDAELQAERQRHAELANQMSLFDPTAKPLVPCPMQFFTQWIDQDGKRHRHECDDWETSAAFSRFERRYGRTEALQILRSKYEDEYLSAGLALAFSTHSRRNVTNGIQNQWLLVGMIRLDEASHPDLFT
jgi:hypothetical protein